MSLQGGSTDWAYQMWRLTGALSVVFGFWALIQVVLHDPIQRRIALFMGVFGGAFSTTCHAVSWLSQRLEALTGWPTRLDRPDFPSFAAHPFGQILVNPHFALPLGLFLLVFAAYVKGEKTGAWWWYAIAGALGAVEGNMRPYDMIALYAIIPVFVVVESIYAGRFEWRKSLHRVLPLVIVAPAFLYSVYLFRFHPVFKYWASQGNSMAISLSMTFLYAGLAGVLVAMRIWMVKRYPLRSSSERLLLAWLVSVICIVHAFRVPVLGMPFSPQILTIFMPPVIILGVVVLDPARWPGRRTRPALGTTLLAGLIFFDALDSIALLYLRTPRADKPSQAYVSVSEMDAYRWISREASENDVVLSLRSTGHRLSKYASVRVVSGHWSVTPHADTIDATAKAFFQGAMSTRDVTAFLKEYRVTWIYVGSSERKLGEPDICRIPGFTKHVINDDVTVYHNTRR